MSCRKEFDEKLLAMWKNVKTNEKVMIAKTLFATEINPTQLYCVDEKLDVFSNKQQYN